MAIIKLSLSQLPLHSSLLVLKALCRAALKLVRGACRWQCDNILLMSKMALPEQRTQHTLQWRLCAITKWHLQGPIMRQVFLSYFWLDEAVSGPIMPACVTLLPPALLSRLPDGAACSTHNGLLNQ